MRTRTLLSALLILLAGCADGGNVVEETAAGEAAPASSQENETVPPELGPAPSVWTLAADGRVFSGAPESDAPEEVALDSFSNAVTGQPFGIFSAATEAMPGDLLVHEATFTMFLRHDSAGANAGLALGIDGAAGVGAGTSASNGEILFLSGPDVMTRGQVAKLSGQIQLPAGGLIVPAGEAFAVGAAAFYAQADAAGSAVLLLNSLEAHTRFDIRSEWIRLPAGGNVTTILSESATTEGGGGCGGDAAGIVGFDFQVPEDAVGLTVVADAGGLDVDITVSGPSGEAGRANYPGSPETLRLHAPNIEAVGTGAWHVDVATCLDEATNFDITVDVVQAPAQGP